MKGTILRTERLGKTYQHTQALHNVTLRLEAGRIYGLIGENGAGKTTLMRMIAGLGFPSEGHLELFGERGERALREQRSRIGCLIEQPGINLQMDAGDNMRMHRIMRGIPNEETERELLAYVGLADTGKKKVKHFSSGMKQRLGIALALIGNPEFLILDEPVNGLDPAGMVEIRNMLRKLCEERNMTILISSHNLPELWQTATDYIIIHRGEVRRTLTVQELEECCEHYFQIKTNDPDRLVSVIERELHTTRYKVMPDRSVRLMDYLEDVETVAEVLLENRIVIHEFTRKGVTLEEYFLSVTGGGPHD